MDWIVEVNNHNENIDHVGPSCAFNCGREISPPCTDAFCVIEFGGPPCGDKSCGVLIGG